MDYKKRLSLYIKNDSERRWFVSLGYNFQWKMKKVSNLRETFIYDLYFLNNNKYLKSFEDKLLSLQYFILEGKLSVVFLILATISTTCKEPCIKFSSFFGNPKSFYRHFKKKILIKIENFCVRIYWPLGVLVHFLLNSFDINVLVRFILELVNWYHIVNPTTHFQLYEKFDKLMHIVHINEMYKRKKYIKYTELRITLWILMVHKLCMKQAELVRIKSSV
ncbi:hypothetical protein AGLY_010500 [Aphis glycines]|uniref:Uncharacterized protein n=1 Tax=Aphis glycines TaxID=307491 RepID=A0A6G0TEC3_APHGL|nr:hypothetical protein AGLY_010500 [Aphis glycines]